MTTEESIAEIKKTILDLEKIRGNLDQLITESRQCSRIRMGGSGSEQGRD